MSRRLSRIDSVFGQHRSVAPLTAEEEQDLGKLMEQGDWSARDRLVEATIPFALFVAKRYVASSRSKDLEDLVGEATLGLVRAAELWDFRKGRFTTLANFWVRQAIGRFLESHGAPVRIPRHAVEWGARWSRKENELAARLGRRPTEEETRKAAGFTEDQADIIAKGRAAKQRPTRDDEEGDPLLRIPDYRTPEPKPHEDDQRWDRVEKAMAELEPEERKIIRAHYRLDDKPGNKPGLAGIAKRMRKPTSHVIYMKDRGLAKLREAVAAS